MSSALTFQIRKLRPTKPIDSEEAGEEWVNLPGEWHLGSSLSVDVDSVCLVPEGLLGRDKFELGIERLI